jgi:hypothetical protein
MIERRDRRTDPAAVRTLLAETLLTFCSPKVAGRVVLDALDRARLEDVPENLDQFQRFLQVDLRDVLIERVGLETAEAVMADLERVLPRGRASGTYRRTTASIARIPIVRKPSP